MTAENRLPDFIEEMVRSATDALTFTEGMDEKSFLDDIKTQRAVVMCLMIIGEAANRIVADFPDFARENQNIPWNDIRGIRNRIAHGYFKLRAFFKTQANSSSDIASLHDDWILVSTLHDSLDLAAKFRPDSTKNPFKPSKRV